MSNHRGREIAEIVVRNAVSGNKVRTYFLFDCTCGFHVSSDDRREVVRSINKHAADESAREVAAHAGQEVIK